MKTQFTDTQLERPEIAQADRILATCQHFGFCTSGCPTYTLLHDENDGPRGRIDLIKEMLERGGRPSPKTVAHIDRCLSCMSCMTTCAVKVDYLHLVDIGRAYIEEHHRRPWRERWMRAALAYALPRPRVFGPLLAAGRVAGHLAGRFEALVPESLRHVLALVPPTPGRDASRLRPATVYPAQGQRRWRVALLAGCVQPALSPQINAATVRLLTRLGCEVVMPTSAGCCGSLNLHMGKRASAAQFARANVRSWTAELEGEGLDAILVNASGCGTTVKDYGHLLGDDPGLAEPARRVAALALDVSEWLARIGLPGEPQLPAYKVAYHDACSLRNAQKVTAQPRALLRQAGFQVADIGEAHFCCGSAGTYNLLQPKLARELGTRKAAHIARVRPQIVAAGNIGCIHQIRQYSAVPVVHTVELLDWASGGPLPPALAGLTLTAPASAPPSAAPAVGVAEAPIYIHKTTDRADDADLGVW